MNKRNIFFIILAFTFLVSFGNKAYSSISSMPDRDTNVDVSVNTSESSSDEKDIIKKISFRDKLKRSPESQITSFINKYNRCSSKKELEKLKKMYTDSYVNNDGFDKNTIFKMMQMASESYKNEKYTTEILDIKVNGNYANVKAYEVATAETNKVLEKFNDNGIVKSEIYYTDYLVKDNGDWKISATDVTYEKVSLLYGEAKNIIANISAPDSISEGTQYETNLTIDAPEGAFMVGSIVNEKIVFPQVQTKDVFRTIKNGELSRILTSNKDGHNEYATATIAITRAQAEPASIVLNMTGMGFVMKRVNILSAYNVKEEKNGI